MAEMKKVKWVVNKSTQLTFSKNLASYKPLFKKLTILKTGGRNSDSLRAERTGDLVLMLARFSDPVQTGPEAHPASCAIGVRYFPRAKRPGRGADHQLSSIAEVANRLEINLCLHFALA